MTAVQRSIPRCIAQTARVWPTKSAGWTTQPRLIPFRAVQGSGGILGSAELEQDTGIGIAAGEAAAGKRDVGPLWDLANEGSSRTLRGQYLRLLREDDDGTVEYQTRMYAPFWWGIVGEPTEEPDTETIRYSCDELPVVLDEIFPGAGHGETSSGSLIELGWLPPFNMDGWGYVDVNSINGVTVLLPGRPTTNRWTAYNALQYLLAAYSRPQVPYGKATTGPLWSLVGNSSDLAYELPPMDLRGKSLLAMVNAIISPSRGLTWRLDVSSAGAVRLRYVPITGSSITINSKTIPAPTKVNVDLRSAADDAVMIDAPRVRHTSAAYDMIRVESSQPPLVAVTLEYRLAGGGSLVTDGWSTSGGAAYGTAAYRRFAISSTWDGATYGGGDGLRHALRDLGSAADGSRTFTTTVPKATGLRLNGMTTAELNWPGSSDRDSPRAPPVVLIQMGTSDWVDASDRLAVNVSDDGTALVIGSSEADANWLRIMLQAGSGIMLVTIGVYEWAPIAVEWVRDVSAWPRDTPRVLNRIVGDAQQWRIAAGCAYGATSGRGTLLTHAGQTVRDDSDAVKAELLRLVARYGTERSEVDWTEHGVIEAGSTLAPGAMIGEVKLDRGTLTLDAVIVTRSYDLQLGTTTYQTRIIDVDNEAN